MSKILIICGSTATGKTSFGLQVGKQFNGEIISADSRQVYTGMDIVTGKDLPTIKSLKLPSPEMRRGLPAGKAGVGGEVERAKEMRRGLPAGKAGAGGVSSNLQWKNRFLRYYLIDNIKVWLYDIVNPDEEYNLSFWKECADLVIADIHKRGKLPIVVGGTGLYIKSLTQNLDQINVSPNQKLRNKLAGKSPGYLLDYLARLDQSTADRLNDSDRKNPRRLVRAIEIASSTITILPSPELRRGLPAGKAGAGGEVERAKELRRGLPAGKAGAGGEVESYQLFQVGLTAPKESLYSRINQRVDERVSAGAVAEAKSMLAKYDHTLPSLSASGYRAFSDSDPINKWKILERQYARRQLTWFKKQPGIVWFDVSTLNFKSAAIRKIANWYNKN